MTQSLEEQLKKEFIKNFEWLHGEEPNHETMEEIDWWLSKLSSLLSQRADAIRGIENDYNFSEDPGYYEAYKEALEASALLIEEGVSKEEKV